MNVVAGTFVADLQSIEKLRQAARRRDPQPVTCLGDGFQRPAALAIAKQPWLAADDIQDGLAGPFLIRVPRGKKRACARVQI